MKKYLNVKIQIFSFRRPNLLEYDLMIYIINTIKRCIRKKYPKITKTKRNPRRRGSISKNSPEYKAL